MTKCLAVDETKSRSRCVVMLGWYPLLAKNGEIPVVALGHCYKQILQWEVDLTNCPVDSCNILEGIVPRSDSFIQSVRHPRGDNWR